jgi:putative dimethyl sulfoxide reductase chaperone
MSSATLQHPDIQQTLGRAAIYQLLSLAFAYPDEEGLAELGAFITDVTEHPIATETGLLEPLGHLSAALERTRTEELAGEHMRLFAGEVACSAHESEYAFDPFAKSRQLADVAGFYTAFGLEVAHDRRGLPDFISTELEFVSLMLRKQVYADSQGWSDRSDLTSHAIDAFLEDHLGRWAPMMSSEVSRVARDEAGFYAAAGELCRHYLTSEIKRRGIRPRPVRPRSTSEQDAAPFVCPLVPDVDQGGEQPPAADGPSFER